MNSLSSSPLRPAANPPATGNGGSPGAMNTQPPLPSFLTTRGAVSLNFESTRSTQRSAGSIMWESAEITCCAAIENSSSVRKDKPLMTLKLVPAYYRLVARLLITGSFASQTPFRMTARRCSQSIELDVVKPGRVIEDNFTGHVV